MLIKWNDTYNLNIDLIDTQHKNLIDLINDLYLAQKSSTSQLIIAEVLEKLVDYTKYHFSSEEEMMRKCKYPKLDEHAEEHDEFKSTLSELNREAKNNNLLISLKTLCFLKDWTITHILGTDKEFGDYLVVKELGSYNYSELHV